MVIVRIRLTTSAAVNTDIELTMCHELSKYLTDVNTFNPPNDSVK